MAIKPMSREQLLHYWRRIVKDQRKILEEVTKNLQVKLHNYGLCIKKYRIIMIKE
jgi:hypothetical protein